MALASLALPPGPKSDADVVAATILLVLTSGAVLAPWPRIPSVFTVLVPLAYTASVLMLILAAGGYTSGVGIVLLVPLVWTALYHRPWESGIVVVGIVAVQAITSLTPVPVASAVIIRRLIFWTAMGVVVSVAVHELRAQVRRTFAAREELHRRTEALEAAAEQLTSILSPHDVLEAATRLAAEMVSPPGTPGRRAQYARVSGEIVKLVAQYDEAGQFVAQTFPLAEHPNLAEAIHTCRAIHRDLDPVTAGPTVREIIKRLGATHSVYVPVICQGEVDGVLSVSIRGVDISADLFEQCKAVGHLTELALSNALAHEKLRELASTDPLTGLPNRRGFDQLVENGPRRNPFAIVVVDLDGLKQINDRKGHSAGDALLVHAANTVRGSLRRGDALARIGGDEFVAFLFDADENDARRAAERMLSRLAGAVLDGDIPSASIGIAAGLANAYASEVYEAADAAMYVAKRKGGGRYEVAVATTAD
ncbi:MAG TPA: GGDEF domain-containing protein [Acidimicrobiales bacterium]|nr:GGDEF domain-containing protein [Acidimicrobiales bacterium]